MVNVISFARPNLFTSLKRKGFVPQTIQLKRLHEVIFHVEVLGSHYLLFVSDFFEMNPLGASKVTLAQLSQIHPMNRVILYMDHRTKE